MSNRVLCINPACLHTVLEETAKTPGGLCMACFNAIKEKKRTELVHKKSDRIPCINPACLHTILEQTEKITGGLCMACVNGIREKKRVEFFRKKRKDFNAFKGISDPVEILKLLHAPRKYDALINWIPYPTPIDEVYQQLSLTDIQRLIDFAITLVAKKRHDQAEGIAKSLVAFCGVSVDLLLQSFIDHDIYHLGLAFYNASPAIRNQLIDRISQTDWAKTNSLCLNQLLVALAWIGDAEVVALFNHWKHHPPVWSKILHISPEYYAHAAGWELSEKGQRRNLYFEKCWALSNNPSKHKANFSPISERSDTCPGCGLHLINLITCQRPFSELPQLEHIQIITCELCTRFETIFGLVDEDGGAHWAAANSQPTHLPHNPQSYEKLPKDCLYLDVPRKPFFAADKSLPISDSQLGGHPTWIQDSEYPKCPTCSQTMMFVAQIAESDEIYYLFLCDGCKMTATNYQCS